MKDWINSIIEEKKRLLEELKKTGYVELVEQIGDIMVEAINSGNKIILAGNGGSACDAQHFAGEIVGRFTMDRPALPAISLCVDPSVMTCVANDYGFSDVFARQIAGLGLEGDIFVPISTSGNSQNLINAINIAREKNIKVVGFLGKNGGKIKELCDYALIVPSDSTPRIQETHTLTVHLLCELIEKRYFA